MMNTIFISYRRDDSQLSCDRIYGYLGPIFGMKQVFRDLNTIPGGVDFRTIIDEGLSHCKVVLAIIGPQWTTITDASGQRRLDDSSDFVRLEIESALHRNIPVIPLLVQRAQPLRPAELPETMQKLAFQNTRFVRADPDFARDMQLVMLDIAQFVPIPRRDGGFLVVRNLVRQLGSFVVGLISFLLLVAAISTWINIPIVTTVVNHLLNR
jgi:hypothetical protein